MKGKYLAEIEWNDENQGWDHEPEEDGTPVPATTTSVLKTYFEEK